MEKQATLRGMTLRRLGAFHSWLAHGRKVRKGEKGLMCYAPHPCRNAAPRSPDGDHEEDNEEERPRFHVVYLFDESQTEPLITPEESA